MAPGQVSSQAMWGERVEAALVRDDAVRYREVLEALDGARALLTAATRASSHADASGGVDAGLDASAQAQDADLAQLLEEIANRVSSIRRESHHALVERLFDGVTRGRGLSPWFMRELSRRALLDLATHFLVSGTLTQTALAFVVQCFCPPIDVAAWPSPAAERQIVDEVREMAKIAIQVAPAAHEDLLALILTRVPHKYTDARRSECFVSTVFWLAAAPMRQAADRLLSCVIDRLVELDVEVQWEGVRSMDDAFADADIDGDDAMVRTGPASGGEIGDLDEADVFEVAMGDGFPNPTPSRLPDPYLDKLDALLAHALRFVKAAFDTGEGAAVLDAILSAYQRAIFPVGKLRAVQSLAFYACARAPHDPRLVGYLAAACCAGPALSPSVRASAMDHLGSLLYRLTGQPPPSAQEALEGITKAGLHFARAHPPGVGAGAADLALFGAACRAAVAIFCAMAAGGAWGRAHAEASFRRLGLRDMLEHWTRPMRACNAHAGRELVRNAEHAGWINRMGAKRLAAEAGDWEAPPILF